MSELPDFDRMWNYNEPKKTEKAFRDLISAAQSSANRDYHAQLLTQIARTQSLQRKFEAAHQILDEVEALLDDETPIARIRYCQERGRAFNSANNVEAARPLFQQAWELACKEGEDYHAIDAAHMMGICERDNSNLSLSWNEKAMEVAEKSDHPRAKGWLGALYNNTGWTFHDLGQYGRALDLFEKGLIWRQERNDDRATRVAKWTVARALRSLGRVEEALMKQQALLKEHEEIGSTAPFVQEEIGECLLILGKSDEAHPYFARAYEELSNDAWLKDHEPDRINRLKNLAEGGEL